jgi:aryl-alcohol dehydrogenase-like predicted oxidoreductase
VSCKRTISIFIRFTETILLRPSIAWLLANPVVTSVIIGAKRLDQLQDNLAAAELTLTQDELVDA